MKFRKVFLCASENFIETEKSKILVSNVTKCERQMKERNILIGWRESVKFEIILSCWNRIVSIMVSLHTNNSTQLAPGCNAISLSLFFDAENKAKVHLKYNS